MITIIDYGAGNPGSIQNMLRKLGYKSLISGDRDAVKAADKLILPGVGAFDTGMQNLADLDLVSILHEKVLEQKTPILGICLGVQLFTRGSEEGDLPGLSWVDAETVRFRFPPEIGELRVPHMGWSTLDLKQDHPVLRGVDESFRFYFVHSYHLRCADPRSVLATTRYGVEFDSAVIREGHVIGVQFHPEKSHRFGMQVLRNFAELP